MTFIPTTTRRGLLAAFSLAAAAMATPALAAGDLPGQGVVVQPLKSTIAEETFQTEIVMKALEKLGYDVQPIKEVDYPAAHLAIASGDGSIAPASGNTGSGSSFTFSYIEGTAGTLVIIEFTLSQGEQYAYGQALLKL